MHDIVIAWLLNVQLALDVDICDFVQLFVYGNFTGMKREGFFLFLEWLFQNVVNPLPCMKCVGRLSSASSTSFGAGSIN